MAQPQAHNTYLSGYTPKATQHHEWRDATNSAAHLLPILTAKACTNSTLSFLDVGAGSGTITASLARHIPHGRVVATDLSAEFLSKALRHAKSVDATNVETRQASIYDLPFADSSFDVVHASQLLAHLDDPVQAVREMVRVAKKAGGVCVQPTTVIAKNRSQPLDVLAVRLFWLLCLKVQRLQPDAGGSLVLYTSFCLEPRLLLLNLRSTHLHKL